jgi:hypothetical protein
LQLGGQDGRMEPLGALLERWLPKGVIAHVQVNDRKPPRPRPGRAALRPGVRFTEKAWLRGRSRSRAVRLRARRSPVPPRAPSATFGGSWKRWTPEEGRRG